MFLYRGQPHILRRFVNTAEYGLTCPKCGQRGTVVLDPTEGHAIVSEPGRGISVQPSVVCPFDCGWHVLIENGEARDV